MSASKGTQEYTEIFDKLSAIQYASGSNNQEDEEEIEDIIEEPTQDDLVKPHQQFSINRGSELETDPTEQLLKPPETKASPRSYPTGAGGSSGDFD